MYQLSIIIPTKNRFKYAHKTILACLEYICDCEIIISDSSTDDKLENFIKELDTNKYKIKGNFINYIRTNHDFSVVENFNSAIPLVNGLYVCVIGDDDLISESINEVIKIAKKRNIECINFKYSIKYYWPDFISSKFGKFYSGKLMIEKYSGRWSIKNPLYALRQSIKMPGCGPQGMPRIYAGLVSKDIIDRIINKYSHLFGGVSPDVYSSVLLAHECKSFAELDFPVIIPGSSGLSAAGLSANSKHVGELYSNPHIIPFKSLKWDFRIPEFYSVQTVWAFSMQKALDKIDKSLNANHISTNIQCFIYHKEFFKETYKSFVFHYKNMGIMKLTFLLFKSIIHEGKFIYHRITRLIFEKYFRKQSSVDNLKDTVEAAKVINQKIKTKIHMIH